MTEVTDRSRATRGSRACGVLMALAGLTAACTPPIVRESGDIAPDLRRLPAGTRWEEVRLASGEALRGAFLPGEEGAPVVLHLLESGGSITRGAGSAGGARGGRGRRGYRYLHELRDLGFSQLALDWRGVGASDGARSPDHIAEDARAMYDAAVRLAGSEDRVVLRSTSLGTLGAASLILSTGGGAKPAAWICVSPVCADTVARNVACSRYGTLACLAVRAVFCDACDSDLLAAIETAPCPLLVVLGSDDELLSDAEREAIEAAARGSWSGRFCARDGLDHVRVSRAAYSVLEEERAVLASLFPKLPDRDARLADLARRLGVSSKDLRSDAALCELAARHRIEPPSLAPHLARCMERMPADQFAALFAFVRNQESDAFDGVPDDALAAWFDFDDPDGPLDPRELEPISRFNADVRAWPVEWSSLKAWETTVNEQLYGVARSPRQAMRLLLKSALLPERLGPEDEHFFRVETFAGGAWRAGYECAWSFVGGRPTAPADRVSAAPGDSP